MSTLTPLHPVEHPLPSAGGVVTRNRGRRPQDAVGIAARTLSVGLGLCHGFIRGSSPLVGGVPHVGNRLGAQPTRFDGLVAFARALIKRGGQLRVLGAHRRDLGTKPEDPHRRDRDRDGVDGKAAQDCFQGIHQSKE